MDVGPGPIRVKDSIILKNLFNISTFQETLDWQPFRDGVDIIRIYGEPGVGSSAALLRYQPGASVPLHKHMGYEHIIVLWRAQEDAKGVYEAGSLVINPPGSSHAVSNKSGCIVLVIWEKPVEFVTP